MQTNKKKILVVSQYFWPENFRVNELVLGFQKKGFDVEVLTSIPNYPSGKIFKEYKDNPKKFSFYNNILVHRVPQILRGTNKLTILFNYISFVISSCYYCFFYLRKKDYKFIFGVQLSPIFSIIPAILCKKIFNKKLFVWVLDIWPDSINSVSIKLPNFLYLIVKKISTYIYLSADYLFITSMGFKNRLIEMGVHDSKIKYFPQWIEKEYLTEVSQNDEKYIEVNNILSKWADKKLFLFTGNIGEAQDFKNLLLGFKNAKEINSLVFLIIGDGRYKVALKNLITKHALSDNVHLLGSFDSDYMKYFYNRADILVFSLADIPIFNLTLPGKVQSYMSSGKTIIGMVNGESSYIIKDAGCGFISDSGNSLEFSKLIDKCCLMSDRELDHIGSKGKEYASKNFSYENLMNKVTKYILS